MKRIITRCDCCGKEKETPIKLVLPILHIGDDTKYAKPYEVDVCVECARRFFDLYYQIAEENHFSGIRAIDMGGEF